VVRGGCVHWDGGGRVRMIIQLIWICIVLCILNFFILRITQIESHIITTKLRTTHIIAPQIRRRAAIRPMPRWTGGETWHLYMRSGQELEWGLRLPGQSSLLQIAQDPSVADVRKTNYT
jgi:hypothetical protein